MSLPKVSIYRWAIGGALIGSFLTLAVNALNGIQPYEGIVSMIFYIAGTMTGGALMGGVSALIINRIRGRK
jgi:hypothetical protein